ncbi:cob(I)yrinic acid a,c-diamide adenosyltransferase [Methanogenium organophilum]|uniref:Cob(I)yrinic acid a,c-diamide adenosyltransferase n=1 Tax=Methanogenium organophilum TaxID=2199 RepID=A0A9X9T7H2_METOG|nr:cob(I)yrinic acid a,c-diamide adenosyltransferase [Methanogenium organophilum]WAI01373.1 cob(I)yrinic acid a,c-diamide adenosyltransferase [Methanogenium organophilum]
MKQGYIQVYTGDGKGKTTAALGVSIRSLVAGHRVYFAQFIKGVQTGELSLADSFPQFTIVQYGEGRFIDGKPEESDIVAARNGLEICAEVLRSGEYDLVVLDEVNVALHYGLFDESEVIAALTGRAPNVDVICTGRYASPELVEEADLVTEMKKIKHYYAAGVRARKGIEF